MSGFQHWYAGLESAQQQLVHWLALASIDGLGAKRFTNLQSQIGAVEKCFTSQGDYTATFLHWARQNNIKLPYLMVEDFEPALEWSRRPGHHILTLQDDSYPYLLKQISSPPLCLYVIGEAELLSSAQIAMVGSRKPSITGRKNAHIFAKELAQQGWTITSGLALGIDGICHSACLEVKGRTIAVLGNGLSDIYPRSHKRLGQQICAQGGALVSEFALYTPPRPAHFPRRNRIISGLSLGVLVIEAAIKSGSLITASYALDQGREIFALPGLVHSDQSKGCHELIRQGAKIVDCVTHITEELPSPISSCQSNYAAGSGEPIQLPDFLKFVDDVCTPIDVVIERAGLPAQNVTMLLMELELDGWISSVPGGYVRNNVGVMP